MKRHAPATARNRQPILDVLQQRLPSEGLVLEVASGSGEHAVHFAAALPQLVFQPSDPDDEALASIDAWAETSGLVNIRPAMALDAEAPAWPVEHADAVLCCNMIHIAPWTAAVGLVAGAARILPDHGLLYLYGPYPPRRSAHGAEQRGLRPRPQAAQSRLGHSRPRSGQRARRGRGLRRAGGRGDAGQQPVRHLPPVLNRYKLH